MLTDNPEVDGVALEWLGADLALVSALVGQPGVPDPQYPIVRVFGVNSLEPLVERVGVTAGADDVQIVLSNPRNLK